MQVQEQVQRPTSLVPELYRRALPAAEHRALEAWAATFWPFQRRWLFDEGRYAVANKSRQIGFSHSTAGLAVLWGAFHGELTTVISVGEREANEVLDKGRRHAALLRRFGSKQARVLRSTSTELHFASGGRVIALPSTGGRSFTGNVFLDEFAYHADARGVWDAAAAVTLLGFRMRVVSTPNGTGNDFHGLWRKAQRAEFGWSPHRVSIDDAMAEGYPVDLEACWTLAKGDPRIFDQMFRCSFLDNEFQYIPSALIDAATASEACPSEGETFAGLDVGRSANLTVLVVVRNVGGVLWVALVEAKKRTENEDIDALVSLALHTFGARRVCIDATGMGTFPAAAMQKKHGRHRVEPVQFTNQVKESLATGLYQRFADNAVRLPRDDKDLRDDIAAIRRMVTVAGNVRYDAPNTSEGHADRAWALALAVHAAGQTRSVRTEILDYDDTDDDA